MRSLLISSFLLAIGPMEAVLPPVWQGVAEVKAILNSEDLNHYLVSGEILKEITKTDEGWKITTNHSQVFVKVVPEPQTKPGPQKFRIEFTRDATPE